MTRSAGAVAPRGGASLDGSGETADGRPRWESRLPTDHPLYRPRHSRRQLVALVFALIFFAAPTTALAFGVRPQAFENRKLASFPSPSQSWGLFTGLSPWATDHLVFRHGAVAGADAVSRRVFGEPAPQGQTSSGGPVGGSPGGDRPGGAQQEVYPKAIEGTDGWLYFGYDVEGKCQPKLPLDRIFRQVNELRRVVESTGRKFVLMVPPDKTTMEPGHLPDSYAGKKCAQRVRDEFWRRLAPRTQAVDLRPDLLATAARLRQPVYYKLDSHWTDDGALLMVRRLAELLWPGVTSTWSVRPDHVAPGPGDLPPLIGKTGDDSGQAYSLAPDGQHNGMRPITPDFNPQPLHFGARPGPGTVPRKVGMFADSFTIPAIPYLGATFTDVTVEHHDAVVQAPEKAAESMIDRDTIVLEIVERNLSSGNSGLLDPGVIAKIGQVLTTHPVR